MTGSQTNDLAIACPTSYALHYIPSHQATKSTMTSTMSISWRWHLSTRSN